MKSQTAPQSDAGKTGRKMRTGYMVFAALVAIKVGEYLISVGIRTGTWPYLAALAMVSAALIVVYYKHIRKLWAKE